MRRSPSGAEGVSLVRAVGLAALVALVWILLAPPAALRPPTPEISDTAVDDGLRMDIHTAAVMVLDYRQKRGRLPRTLGEALPEPGLVAGLSYSVSGEVFEIAGDRKGRHVVYRSTESLTEFVAAARERIRSQGSRPPEG